MSQILRIALPVPLNSLFDYLPSGTTETNWQPGMRVEVPFGRSKKVGVIMEVTDKSLVANSKLKSAHLLDKKPLFSTSDMDFIRWSADYYQHPIGEVVSTALPVSLRKPKSLSPLGQPAVCLTRNAPGIKDLPKRAPKQARILELLYEASGSLSREALRNELGELGVLKAMITKGWIEGCLIEPVTEETLATDIPSLSSEQLEAVNRVTASIGEYQAFLLDGVTGSGKTEVYLSLAKKLFETNQQLLLLVPEIGLTPQLIRRVEKRFGKSIAVLHSGLNETERETSWQMARTGKARLVIGTRSAIFTPMPRLGMILVDEEHDVSYKQQDGFRYSARDLALVRAKQQSCPVVLGTATPSLESLYNVAQKRYSLLRLTERAGEALPPRMDLLDVRDQRLESGLSPVLIREIEKTLGAGQQVLVFLNRRGYAPVMTCYECGWLSDCPRCDAKQTWHKSSGLLWCHHCGSQRPAPKVCPDCGAHELHSLGQGTQQVEHFLSTHFSRYPLVRVDRDTTRRKGSLHTKLEQVRDGRPCILIGTQMLAKGHHLPNVTLAALMDVDGGLFSADYRASEFMAQLVTQVAGRSGRGQTPGRVILQTRYPDHPLLQTLIRRGYDAFAQEALAERKLAQLPPYSYQVLIRAEATEAKFPQEFLQDLADRIRSQNSGLEIWGPVPAPMERKAGRFQRQLILQSGSRKTLHTALRPVTHPDFELPNMRKVRWSIDIDPKDFL